MPRRERRIWTWEPVPLKIEKLYGHDNQSLVQWPFIKCCMCVLPSAAMFAASKYADTESFVLFFPKEKATNQLW